MRMEAPPPSSDAQHKDSAFAAALASVERLTAEEPGHILPECRTRLLHHGHPTAKAFLLFHGYTNCPAQLSVVAEELHRRGHNVFVPLEEGHGRADGSPADLTHVTPDRLAEWIGRTIECARGLGERLTVVGFSVGGVYAAWGGLNNECVDEVIMLSPAFLPYSYPRLAIGLLPLLTRVLPERYLWWDPLRRDAAPLSPYGYARLSRRGISAVFALGQRAWRKKPCRTTELRRAVLVLNEWDFAVNPKAAWQAFEDALVPRARHAELVRLEASLRLPHDYLDPHRPGREDASEVRLRIASIAENSDD